MEHTCISWFVFARLLSWVNSPELGLGDIIVYEDSELDLECPGVVFPLTGSPPVRGLFGVDVEGGSPAIPCVFSRAEGVALGLFLLESSRSSATLCRRWLSHCACIFLPRFCIEFVMLIAF